LLEQAADVRDLAFSLFVLEAYSDSIETDAALHAGIAYHRPMGGEGVRVPLGAELVQKRRRALDVGEEEGDRAGWKLRSHAGIIRRSRRAGKTHCPRTPHARACGAGRPRYARRLPRHRGS
jgi:hypothetical protein